MTPLENLVSLVTEKVAVGKDPAKPYIGLEHISPGGTLKGLGSAADSISANNVFHDGDILFGKLRPRLRKSLRVNFDGYCSTDILVLRPNRRADGEFASLIVASERVFAEAIRTEEGTKMPRCSWESIRDLNVFCPSPEARLCISQVFQSIGRAIGDLEAQVAKYQQIKAGLMQDLFAQGVDSNGHLRSSKESHSTKFGLIPKHWRIGSLLDIADRVRQPILTGPFGADLGADDFIAEGVPVLRIGNVQQGRLDLTDVQFVSEAKARMLERYKIKEGDLLFARQGATTGRNALATADVEGCLINYHVIRVALDQSRCSPLFVEAAFAGETVKRQIERDKGRGTREGINTAQLKALELPLTLVEEQRAIARILRTQTIQIEDTQKELAKLRNLKLGLMQDLLTGRVPVPPKD